MRLTRIVAALAVASFAVPAFDAIVVGAEACAADESDIAVGTELMAVSDVSLHRASLVKGSRVSVTKVVVLRGRIDGLAVALADGHVVKVNMATVRSYFRVVAE